MGSRRGETSSALLDLSVSGLSTKVDTVGGWLGVDGSQRAGDAPVECERKVPEEAHTPRYVCKQVGSGIWSCEVVEDWKCLNDDFLWSCRTSVSSVLAPLKELWVVGWVSMVLKLQVKFLSSANATS